MSITLTPTRPQEGTKNVQKIPINAQKHIYFKKDQISIKTFPEPLEGKSIISNPKSVAPSIKIVRAHVKFHNLLRKKTVKITHFVTTSFWVKNFTAQFFSVFRAQGKNSIK